MTARRSLYGQSLIRNASTASFGAAPSAEPVETYYSLALVSPPKPLDEDSLAGQPQRSKISTPSNNNSNLSLSSLSTTANSVQNNNSSSTPGGPGVGPGGPGDASADDKMLPRYNFNIASWIASNKPHSVPDCDEDDILDISALIAQHDREIAAAAELKTKKSADANSNGLSAADIRGAVGVEEGISGFSGSGASAPAKASEGQAATEKLTEKPVEAAAEKPAETQTTVIRGDAATEADASKKAEVIDVKKPGEEESKTNGEFVAIETDQRKSADKAVDTTSVGQVPIGQDTALESALEQQIRETNKQGEREEQNAQATEAAIDNATTETQPEVNKPEELKVAEQAEAQPEAPKDVLNPEAQEKADNDGDVEMK